MDATLLLLIPAGLLLYTTILYRGQAKLWERRAEDWHRQFNAINSKYLAVVYGNPAESVSPPRTPYGIRTPRLALSWARSVEARRDWRNMAGALMHQSGNLSIAYPTVDSARAKSGRLNLDPNRAPVGAYHFWSSSADGMVGLVTSEGTLTVSTPTRAGGTIEGLGYGKVLVRADYVALPYLGWSMTYGDNPPLPKDL